MKRVLISKIIGKIIVFIILLTVCNGKISAKENGLYIKCNIEEKLQTGDKIAILMVHFGTSHDSSRQKTTDILNQEVKRDFPKYEIREAYSSRLVINILKKRGEAKLNTSEALEKLKSDGFTHILVQTSNIIEGVEMEAIRAECKLFSRYFKEVRCGNPLLYFTEDYHKISSILCTKTKDAEIFVGHGSYDPATAQYAMLEHVMKSLGFSNSLVGTIEGYPGINSVESQLAEMKSKKITLRPLMFVAGEHVKNDIGEDWRDRLKSLGYIVTVDYKSLGEYKEIRKMIMDKILFELENRRIDILVKKRNYSIVNK